MIILVKPNKEYINLKISNCQRLVDEAKSEAQKEAYQVFLDFWTAKLPEAQRPEVIAKKAEEKEATEALAAIAEALAIEEATAITEEALKIESEKADKEAKIAALKSQLAAIEGNPEPEPEIVEIDLGPPIVIEPEELNEINFEKKFPNKKAYRTQNGDRIETIAYKEYLNNSKSESE